MQTSGKLYLVPNTLDFAVTDKSSLTAVLPDQTITTAATISHWICENAKTQRAFLKRINEIAPLKVPLQQQLIHQLPHNIHKYGDHDHRRGIQGEIAALLEPAKHGHDIGLASEAGMPAVADPGSSVVLLAHQLNLTVIPLIGPSSILLALAASGLNGQNFAFVGYLPQDNGAKLAMLNKLQTSAKQQSQSQIFIETPYRSLNLFNFLLRHLNADTRLSLSIALSTPQQFSYTATPQLWSVKIKAATELLQQKKPAIFIIN